jgi:hypothetical protein
MDLLPCPFCGGPASEWETRIESGEDGATKFAVGCRWRHNTVTVVATAMGPWGYRRKDDPPSNEWARNRARRLWNERA